MVAIIVIGIIVLLLTTQSGRGIAKSILSKLTSAAVKIIVFIIAANLVILLIIGLISFIINYFFIFLLIVAILISIIVAICACQDAQDKKQHAIKVAEWQNSEDKTFIDFQIEKLIQKHVDNISNNDTNTRKMTENLPFGRITYFLNFFQHDLANEEPLFFSPVRSNNNDELREYGAVLTTSGLYISKQLNKTDNEGNTISNDIYIAFSGAVYTEQINNTIYIYYVNYRDKKVISQDDTTIPINLIVELIEFVISSGLSKAIYKSMIYDYTYISNEKEENFIKQNAAQGYSHAFEAAGVAASMPGINHVFDEVRYNMNQRQGHGAAAEYGNTVIDRITGDFRAKHFGADNVKDGADRSTHRLFQQETLIQSKYCKTASDTIDNAFGDKHNYSPDMKVEVPRNQYKECVKILQRKIDRGDLVDRGIKPGDKAEDYLRKGYLTYEQALNLTAAGSIESLTIDTMQGIVCASGATCITSICTFAICKWNGMETKDAARQSLIVGAKVMGKATAVYVITMQLSRKNMTNIFSVFNSKAAKEITNPLFAVGENLAKKINSSSLAKSAIGQKLGLNTVNGMKIISSTVAVAVTFGPDICRALIGRISFKQLVKNSAIGVSGIAGAALGQTIIPIPIVGAMVGGAVTSFIAKKALDRFIEDDAIEMFAILKEEFMDIVPLSNLNKDEFNEVVEMTIANKKLPSILRDMYAYGDSRAYAKNQIMAEAVQYVYSKREVITEESYNNAFVALAAETTTETAQTSFQTQTASSQIYNEKVYAQPAAKAESSMQLFCTNCGNILNGDAFCTACGAPTANQSNSFCTGCGAKLMPGSIFCGECGKKI